MIGAVLACSSGAVPERVRLGPSSESQLGAFDKVYVMDKSEENVDGENVNVNGTETRATGGTWELIGNVTVGVASVMAAKRSIPESAFWK
jgi:hypothetical protein